ncbi:MAG: class I SAM-dependent methyltransferase [Verrucomicrobiota bacterium]|nr:class I SAM-dependent methyltransferase [Verrucomicrobiota bacterium]
MNVFETEVERYERWFENHFGAYQSEVAAVRAALPSTGRGLEIGTGTGRFSIPFGIVDGVEPAAAMRRVAEACGLKVLDAKAENLPFPDGTFDFALMVTTICFVDDADLACRAAWRVLKPGGELVIGLVDSDSELGKRYEAHKAESPFYRNARFFSVSELTQIMEKAGFENFSYHQTLFQTLEDPAAMEPVEKGFGRGGFVVVSGRRP